MFIVGKYSPISFFLSKPKVFSALVNSANELFIKHYFNKIKIYFADI